METRESLYVQTKADIDRMVGKAETLLFKIAVPLFAFPKMFGSYFKYYVLGSSESCFQLTYDMS